MSDLYCRNCKDSFKWSDSLEWHPSFPEGQAVKCPRCGWDVHNGIKAHRKK